MIREFRWILIILIAAFSIAAPKSSFSNEAESRLVKSSWTSVVVSVADLDEALALWQGHFGLAVIRSKDGADPDLAALWDIQADDIRRQALVGMPGAESGYIHFVEFSEPGAAIRDGAQAFDSCPKNLDIYVDDMPRRVQELQAAGLEFRNDNYSEVTAPDGTQFREIHLPVHDSINVVLLEVIGKQMPFSPKGFAGVGPLIAIVDDATAERIFYRDVMGFDLLNDNILKGPEIERMIGLPPGSALDVSIWGAKSRPLGQMEIIDYRGVEGNNLYLLAVPTRRGVLHVSYEVDDLEAFIDILREHNMHWTDAGDQDTLTGRGRYIRMLTPAGMRIEVFEKLR